VKLAERSSSVAWIQSNRERISVCKRELIVVGGIRQLRASVGVEETGGNKIQEAASSTSVDDHKGAMWPREGCAIPVRGRL
jgi:hypothetical protein